MPEVEAEVLFKSINNKKISSNNSFFDEFSNNIYKFSKNIFKKDESREPIILIINNVQKPDTNSSNVGATGTIGLSSIKSAYSILNDRISNFSLPTASKDSNRIMLVDAEGNFYNNKNINYPIELFTKINLGFGKLKTSDGNRKINNYGILTGIDFGLLKNKMKIGTSVMFDYSNLNGLYRNSNIKSIVVSLYSKYDIFELKNKNTLYTYGIFSYAHTWESEEAKFINFKNSSNKTANIISLDTMSGYKFNNIGIIPEFGFGIIYGNQDNYTDNIGQNISSRDSIIISLKNNFRYILPVKYIYDNMHIGFKLGLSYDILSIGSNGFDVRIPNGLEYHSKDIEKMDKFSFNYGINYSYDLNSNSKISISYDGISTKNLINNKFSFEYRYNIK